MKVLVVNQSGLVGGAERSLLTLLPALMERVLVAAACPHGPLADELRALGVTVHPIRGTNASFRLHPVYTTRALAELATAALQIRSITRKDAHDVVHANTTRAGIISALCARLGGPPTVVHVRDWIPPGRLPAVVLGFVSRSADAVIANSDYIASSLFHGAPDAEVRVLHNPVDPVQFDPKKVDRRQARQRLGLEPAGTVIGVVAQLTPWKGQDDAIRVVHLLRDRYAELRLVIAGSAKFATRATRLNNSAYARDLECLTDQLGLSDRVVFVGERDDVPEVLGALDLVLVPSWREAFGRIALEGMAMQVPVIATKVGGPAEIVRDGVDGVLLPPRNPELWATTVARLLANPEVRIQMGRRGRERAVHDFSVERHSEAVVAIYEGIARRGASLARRCG